MDQERAITTRRTIGALAAPTSGAELVSRRFRDLVTKAAMRLDDLGPNPALEKTDFAALTAVNKQAEKLLLFS